METNGNVKWNVNAAWIYFLSEDCKWENLERKVAVEIQLYGIYKKCREHWKISELKIHLLSQIIQMAN